MNGETQSVANESPKPRRRFGCLHLLLVAVIAAGLAIVATILVFRTYLHPKPFKPVQLNEKEEKVLQAKLDRMDFVEEKPAVKPADKPEPEAYSEEGADRTIRFSEKELNALLAKNTDLADRLFIDLSKDLVSAKLLLPLDEDFPVFGGKTLRVKTGVSFSYAGGKPVVMLRGVTVMGVPLPNAWLGGLKNIDLVGEFGGDAGFWKAFADGVESLSVEDGLVAITLKE